ncbi:MAG: MFS transporter [Thermoleophilia bacterium]|nr:MFS transporter [Thermoleophilia bacterium]
MIERLRRVWTTPAGRGFIMLATMQLCYGFAYSANNNVITNYFADILNFDGPQFGYMTAIREFGGLSLILLMALLYRVSIPWLSAGAMFIMGLGFALFGVANGFGSVIPWILISSFGMHTILQTQFSMGMSLTTQERSGHVLGRLGAFMQAGTFAALLIIFLIFHFDLLSYEMSFVVMGVVSVIGGIAIIRFPHMQDGEERKVEPKRESFVWRKDYRYYYWLNLLDGVRQQIFFSFGLWVLVNRFKLGVEDISLLLLTVTFIGMATSAYVGRLIDRLGERRVLQAINIGYVVALGGYALANSVYLACVFYVIYSFISMFSTIGASTYLRKIAVPEDIAPSLAMGITILHATAVVVPVLAGVILIFVGYQIPFFIACLAALVLVGITRRLDPVKQRSAARVAMDEARLAAQAAARAPALDEGVAS